MARVVARERPEAQEVERFDIRRTLGAGGLGVVYEAYDRVSEARVALKTLKRVSPEAITRLKREFRALEDLQHPNLVTLNELFEERGEWFFTMELVEGQDFLEYVRSPADNENGSAYDEARLRKCIVQLASGLIALHAAGKVHRDVKPSNVMVTPEGRLVLLDFGLVADVDRDPDWTAANAVGTALYMAPEQAAGRQVGPEADWYAVGAMIYEALTGTPPFVGTTWQVLVEKQQHEPRPPRELAPGVPEDLSTLCLELMRIEPSRRPVGVQVLSRLAHGEASESQGDERASLELNLDKMPGVATQLTHQRAALFMGREAELQLLEDALRDTMRGEQVSVYVRGESGIGKSALIRAFASSCAERDVIVLRGRCYEREAVAYKAVDGVLESLAEVLRTMPAVEASALMPRRASLLLRAFPALTRVPAFANTVREQAVDPQEMRTRLFAAFRELFVRLSVRHSVVIAIDDLQWSDAESLSLLSDLLRAPEAPPLLFIASWRSAHEGSENAGVELEALPRNARWIHLERLSLEHGRSLARALLGVAGADPERADEVAKAADGHPMFIDELARFTSVGGEHTSVARLEDALWGRIEKLEPTLRRLVEVYAMASTPLAPVAAARAARVSAGEFARHLSALRVMRLLRTSATRTGEAAEPYHDSVRRAVRSHLDASAVKALHADIARALRVTGHGNLEQLATHYEAADDREQATSFLQRAAEQAEHALAFGYAADLYRRALSLMPEQHPERHAVLVRRGDALANAGCGLEAAQVYEQASQHCEPREALELARRGAHQLLITGHMDAGIEALTRVLESDGIELPKTPGRALLSVLGRRIQLRLRGLEFTKKDESQVTVQARDRADVCWRGGLSLGMADPIRGQALSLRAVSEAFKVGDPYRVARAIAVQAGYLAASGRSAEAEVDRVLNRAEALAREADSSHGLAVVMGARGQARFLVARYRSAVECCAEAEHLLRERCVGVHWELNIVRLWGMRAYLFLGDYRQVAARLPAILEECRQRHDLYGDVSLRASVHAISLLATDRVDDALADLAYAEQRWSPAGFHTQHYYLLTSKAQIQLYAGQLAEAQALSEQVRAGVERSLLKRVQSVRVITYSLCARVLLAQARGDLAEPMRRRAEPLIKMLRREGVSWATGYASLLAAGVQHGRGQLEQAHESLREAVESYESVDMRLMAACARHRLAELVGGDEGARLRHEALGFFAQQRIVNPERMIEAVAPGFGPK